MNKDELKGKWQQLRGRVQETWGKLTDDDLDVIAGRQEQLVGKIRERYGYAKDRAEEEVRSFFSSSDADCGCDETRPSSRP